MGFGPDNLPFGVVRRAGGAGLPAVRLGERAIGLEALGLESVPPGTFAAPSLNPFLALGAPAWRAVREEIAAVMADGAHEPHAFALDGAEALLPFQPRDYVDFYSSIEHASNVGRIFRPDDEPLLPNWRRLPVGYHGRAGTVVVSGTPIRRPCGQLAEGDFGPEPWLDFEAELGFVTGPGPALGTPIAAAEAAEHIFGFVLVNDWSARRIQLFEYRPLGPFLGKSFATSVSPWVVPLDALAPARVPGPPQEPAPAAYLRTDEPWALDVAIEIEIDGATVSRTNARGLYWNAAQQLAHATVNGASVAAGDLFASGTISGAEPGTYGSLLELSWGGQQPVPLTDGATRTFLEDGDTVVMKGEAGGVSLGEVTGTVCAAA